MTWIVTFTRTKAEHLAKFNLERQGYGVYLPLAVRPGKEVEPEPLFPRYLFVDTSPLHGIWRPIRSTIGCVAVLMTGEAPSPIGERVVEGLRRREEAGVIRLKRIKEISSIGEGEPVRVHEGIWTGFEGVFCRMSGSDRVIILLQLLGGETPVEVEADQIAKVA
jgi:transcriptional antiterminator RfaH